VIHTINSISKLHYLLGVPKPKHPLISVLDLENINMTSHKEVWENHTTKLYTIAIKSGITGKMKYGQNKFDFDEGVLMCMGPNQVVSIENIDEVDIKGYSLTINPDFLLNHTLTKKIKTYDFFSYQVNEALFLSDSEEQVILKLFEAIKNEYENNIDSFSQEVILSNLDLLLIHINRYYNRQFITRKNYHSDLLSRVETVLMEYYQDDIHEELPTVQYLADKLCLSSAYLSDMLKSYTGLSAQQHIHEMVINKAKELLTISELSISQIAYELGFQHPQSFSRLFKKKTGISPKLYVQKASPN